MLLLINNVCFATTIIINPNTVISTSKIYNNVTLDLSNGSFIIKNNATLTINDCQINGTLSDTNPVLITVDNGKLVLTNNTVNIATQNINPHPTTLSSNYVIKIAMGSVDIQENRFTIDKLFTAGLLITTSSIPTSDFKIIDNKFENFHGVLYLLNTDNALVSDNDFLINTYGNIVMIGSNSQITKNTILFAGYDSLANSIDIIDSDNILVRGNLLYTTSCHGINILNCSNLIIDGNRISAGYTYGVNILKFPAKLEHAYLTKILVDHRMSHTTNTNITISNNYLSQNRFGLAARSVDGLIVTDNYFIQRFTDNTARKFWTDNINLLINVSNLTWTGNLYKEAYSQDVSGDNSKSKFFVPFPQTGGVSL